MGTPARSEGRANRTLAVIGDRVLDDAQMTWVAAEVESTAALGAWYDAARADRRAAYGAYRAAADREEAAARELHDLYALMEPDRARTR